MMYKVISVSSMQTREYVDRRSQQPSTFKSLGLVLHDGYNCIYAEALQEMATLVEDMKLVGNDKVLAQIQIACRDYQTQQGETRFSNECTIRSIMKA